MSKVGVLVVNLGTPEAPHKKEVSSYLREFLMDPYVIDTPFYMRWLLVNGVIAPFRSSKSAEAYRQVWTDKGSPLLVISQSFSQGLQEKLQVPVSLGMRYGEPSIQGALQSLRDVGVEKILCFLMYPQFAESSSQTGIDRVIKEAQKLSYTKDDVQFIREFHKQDFYIQALSKTVQEYWQGSRYDHLLLTFHSLPVSHLKKMTPEHCYQNSRCCDSYEDKAPNCYRAHCYKTSRELFSKLQSDFNIEEKDVTTSFQSRLGRQQWIEPNTEKVIESLADSGVKRLLVAAPSFTVDCLETLEELQIRAKEIFLAHGGEEFTVIPCLNDRQGWIEACANYIQERLILSQVEN